ncbi:MAG TPA: peptidylprolyl isomerase [Gemmatimonadales bacterium]
MAGRGAIVAFAVATVAAAPLSAQSPDSGFVSIDRIAAVVGNTPIALSRVNEELNLLFADYQRTQRPVPTDPAELDRLRRAMLDQLIEDELLVQAAQRDTLVQVTDQQVQAAVDVAVSQARSQFTSESEYRRQLDLAGFGTPEEYRRYMTERTRRDMLKQSLMQTLRDRGKLTPIPPTEAETRAYFDATKDQHPRRPATVSLRQIVIRPEPTPAAKTAARSRADSVLRELRSGADFETAARRFSDDPGTKEQGGELGWFRRGTMVPQFEAVAFRLRPGQLSDVVETPFGFHIIQVLRIEPAELRARHVLFIPEVTDADRALALARADTVARALRDGARLDSLSRIYHDPIEQNLFDQVARSDLPQSYQEALEGLGVGEIAGPVELTLGGPARYAVVRLFETKPEGEYTFDELRDQLRGRLSEDSGRQRLLRDLRETTYVDIRL